MSLLMPNFFRGVASENCKQWCSDFESYCMYKKLTDGEVLGLFPLLLKDGAKFWLDGVTAHSRATYADLKAAFISRFKRDDINAWRDVATVWTTVQSPTQSVDEYILEVQQKALLANMDPQQLLYCVLNGLKPAIRQLVLQHEPKDLSEVTRWANIAESSEVQDDIPAMLKRIEQKFNMLQVTELAPPRTPRSPSPVSVRRVQFQSDQHSNFANRPEQVQPRNSPAQPVRYDRSYTPNMSNTVQQGSCYNCGLAWHPKQQCPARNVHCHCCRRVGHYGRVCRASRRFVQP